ncbi:hypothetical protein FT663_03411 [Candidozyma haemuli var. vulneris]|uniref:Mediator of RNA polymerase II transcription subunit 7 n=1 Tax=Candidozyma haemuli TaxID=45357 RepID=A0A2V1AXP2_9ASCO|nr:hypothetical protein CXQ85_005136 [[Candida] haemuloni]KAF3987360.1 hypothetical protein FT662_04032 [[Candida] haemuloni var. vulneris]KAF3989934.1 hypothetical protein FT663_03411 [[Candida] haemuloni var. vulneris]PVH22564.1 hypothetical protein CXQ85_005136 [[Candida] haemuloni]
MSEDLISSLYPSPPPYYKFFSDGNAKRFESWKSSNDDDGDVPPGDLKFHQPPPIPTGEQYRGYGSVWALANKLPSLQDSGWRQLYNDEDEKITSRTKILELHKLLDSLLLNFLELVGSVSKEPAKFYGKIEDLKLILINMNHLLNTYRPHQTRESLIMLLKRQIEGKRNDIRSIDETVLNVKNRIKEMAASTTTDSIILSHDIIGASKDRYIDRDEILETLRSLLNEQ